MTRTEQVRSETDAEQKGHDHCRECSFRLYHEDCEPCCDCDGHSEFVEAPDAH